ncbi:virulence factor TspB C-terminal domain-related protein [Acinetobacter baumannii]|uniref:virulence factor TspB C-terminal domain-related protein n=1 Tax=Acinetobacter baumannii TaxID=470 RepID=UPI00244B72F9|nr:virulence factor TspB C-terminal domain-related protein [Acinetobacter baumannii]MDH2549545.1 virulence factor TspB C-terminal domain-related protein [Acinetobacter baumannii]
MVNRLSFRNLRIDNFKLITWLQIFIIAISPNFIFFQSANATTVASEGWNVSKRLIQGATTFYDGTKGIILNGKNYAATGVAKITPNASQVAKMIVRTGAVLAVDLAIKSLINGVSYVMDPANNRVKYYPDPSCTVDSCVAYYFQPNGWPQTYTSAIEACKAVFATNGWKSSSVTASLVYSGTTLTAAHCEGVNNSGAKVTVDIPARKVSTAPPREEKYLAYEDVAAKVISNAVAEDNEAKGYVSSVADTALEDEQTQIIPADQVIDQLNQSQAIPTSNTATGSATPSTGTGTGTGTGDPTTQPGPTDITLNFPVFCSWAPTVCQAAQVAINFPGTVANYWKELKEWMNESASDTSETKPEIKELELNFDDGSRINFDQTCPQPQPIQVTFMGVTQDASFSFEPLCNFMIMIRPFVIGSAYLIGAYIVMGLSRGNSE